MRAAAEGVRGDYPADEPLTAADVLLLTGTVRYSLHDYDASLADLEDVLARSRRTGPSAPGQCRRDWMRPWMLSALLARAAGNPDAVAPLAVAAGAHAATARLSPCLANPGETACLALPRSPARRSRRLRTRSQRTPG